MEGQDLPLRDIHLPAPVGWWPPAVGWWLLAIGAVLSLAVVLWAWRRLREPSLRAQALRELSLIENSDEADAVRWRRLAILLRRVCLSLYPHEDVAGLSGEAWLERLAQAADDGRFRKGVGRLLLDSPYRRQSQDDVSELLAICRSWFRRLPRRAAKG